MLLGVQNKLFWWIQFIKLNSIQFIKLNSVVWALYNCSDIFVYIPLLSTAIFSVSINSC